MKIGLTEKIVFSLVFTLCLMGVYFSHTDLHYYEDVYVREDGFIEWLTVVALLLGSFICLYRSTILKPFRSWKFRLFLILFGLVFLFGAGEEISWGQRIFHIESSSFFLQNNSQGEMNLHNLVISGKKINKIVFGTFLGIAVGFYLLILPVLYRKLEKIKKLVDDFAIPLPQNIHIGLYVLLVIIVELITGGKKGEILEFGGCWIFTLMVLNPYNREIFSRKSFER